MVTEKQLAKEKKHYWFLKYDGGGISQLAVLTSCCLRRGDCILHCGILFQQLFALWFLKAHFLA